MDKPKITFTECDVNIWEKETKPLAKMTVSGNYRTSNAKSLNGDVSFELFYDPQPTFYKQEDGTWLEPFTNTRVTLEVLDDGSIRLTPI